MSVLGPILIAAVGLAAIIFLVVPLLKGVAWLIGAIFRGIGAVVMHLFRFIGGMVGDVVRFVGAIITAIVFTPLIVANVVIGRWSAASHFGRGLQDEVKTAGHCVYRVGIGHPARFLLLHGLVEGIEQRIPDAMAQSPGSDRPSRRTGEFDGYAIVGSLQGGGSGGRLFIADPDEKKRAVFMRNGQVVDQVVIKSFSLQDGSSLPQIIRESRALESAKKLGLVLDHELNDERFYYAMPYVPGDNLTIVTKRLHSEAGPRGLEQRQLSSAMSYMRDLLKALAIYHHGGLWHKDVKPDNIIVSGGKAHVVDLGLVTPLRSAMTLTTHGTEYFRDPEMVRMALRGAKVKDVDGVKFDLYGAGAVMYAVLENNFPAHGGLSQFSKKSPEAMRWIVRRSMTDLHKRYASADEMLADLRVVIESSDPYAIKPADLPSVKGGSAGADAVAAVAQEVEREDFSFGPEADVAHDHGAAHVHKAASPIPPREGVGPVREGTAEAAREAQGGAGAAGAKRNRPKLAVTDWITGRYTPAGEEQVDSPPRQNPDEFVVGFAAGIGKHAQRITDQVREHIEAHRVANSPSPRRPHAPARVAPGERAPAHEQLKSARARAHEARNRIRKRMKHSPRRYRSGPNPGVFVAIAVVFAAVFGAAILKDSFEDRKGELNRMMSHVRQQLGGIQAHIGDQTFTFDFDRDTDQERTTIDDLNRMGEALAQESEWSALGEVFRAHDARSIEIERMTTANIDEIVSGAIARSTAIGYDFESARGWAPKAHVLSSSGDPRGTILVLNRLPSDVEHDNTAELDALMTHLVRRGFRISGIGDNENDIELAARAENTIGTAPPTDAEARMRLESWLESGEAKADAILWLSPSDDRGRIDTHWIVCPEYDRSLILRALQGG